MLLRRIATGRYRTLGRIIKMPDCYSVRYASSMRSSWTSRRPDLATHDVPAYWGLGHRRLLPLDFAPLQERAADCQQPIPFLFVHSRSQAVRVQCWQTWTRSWVRLWN
jgi:hypothetical protein